MTEKYTVCAAAHDACCTGVETINPWQQDNFVASVFYVEFCDEAAKLHDADRRAVESFLADVEANLASDRPAGRPFPAKLLDRQGQGAAAALAFRNRSEAGYQRVSEVIQSVGPAAPPINITAQAVNVTTPAVTITGSHVAVGQSPTGQAKRKRSKSGEEKWRAAQQRMKDLIGQGKLPQTLRQAAKLLESEGYKYNTVRDAAHNSPTLRNHFGLSGEPKHQDPAGGKLLEELVGTLDRQGREYIQEHLTPERRQQTESQLQGMSREQQLELVKELAKNPDGGSCGDVPLDRDEQDPASEDYTPKGRRWRQRRNADRNDED